jgi:sulfofructose kinase
MIDILCIGHATYDINIPLESYPVENIKIEINSLLEEGGGPAANAACLLSKWGVACAFAGVVGNDVYGNRIVEEFKSIQTDIAFLNVRDDYVTPLSFILVNGLTGSRTIINRKIHGIYAHLDDTALKEINPKVLLFDGHEPDASLKAMEVFPEARTILDAGSLRKGTEVLASRVDYLVSSERFALSVTGLPDLDSEDLRRRCVERLRRLNDKHVIVTLGEKGLIYEEQGNFRYLPAYPAKPVDTTGAGDVFHGAFAYGIFMNMKLLEVLKLSSMAAAMSVEVSGARRSIPGLQQVLEALENSR